MAKLNNNRGFTLIEILVVITMVGILSTILVPQITKQLDKPKKSRAVIEITAMKHVLDMYFAENNVYPTDKAIINALMKENGVLGGKYGEATADDPWGNPYYIKTTANTYIIWSEGPRTDDEEKDDIYTDQNKTDVTVHKDNLQINTATTNSNDNS
ncbi:general secretion pathway protein G [Desulforamulus putei DSM 12395]|uniref:General secretion pathway protein G n=1 Tax=Desulforamulus putei DSM 12395 TaxID=1121429 RepID=A0A1M4UUZ5_9FIRM|nr:type II secretion system protein GspG [Desulforamulus putei]SHE60505.1 general secretion pathway protein G [Desulforamulus putei DSM 12395]